MKSLYLALIACFLTSGLVSVAWAQRFEGRGDFRRGEGRDEGRSSDSRSGEGGERRRGGFDPKEMIRRIDRNGNGTIEPDEMSDRSREFIGRLARQANLDPSQPLSVDKLITAAESSSPSGSSSSSDSRDRDRSSSGSSSSRSSSTTPPNPMGFGVADTAPKAATFEVPLTVDTSVPLEKRYDPRVIEYVERMLKDYDKNGDGYIDSIEWKDGKWSTPPETSDTNKDGRLSKVELCERVARRFGLTAPPSSSSSSGFGSGSSSSTSSTSPSSSSSSGSSSDAAKIRGWAEGMVKQHDKNRNGVLDRDEWDGLRAEHREADTNKDGVITVDELVLKLQAYSSGSSSSTTGRRYSRGGSSSSGSGSSDRRSSWTSRSSSSSSKPTDRKDYRLSTALDRLPKGLPDWFLRNDADGDGQIAMSEYAVTWTDATAEEFQKYDLDGDGFITPAEVLASSQRR